MIRAVLLDVDGTLVDSNDVHARAWVEAFAEFGRTVQFERVRPLIGKAALLEICGGSKLVHARTSSDDAEQSKPDGDIIAAALSRSGAAPHEALMLGDTPYDVEAARRVGVRTVALRSGGWDDAALAEAVAIYANASDLLDRYADSPFVR